MLSTQERDEFLERVKKEGIFIILEAEEKYRDDEIIMKGLVKLNGGLLACASDRLKKNEEVIKAALSSKHNHLSSLNGKPYDFAIQFVDEDYLISHPEYVLKFLETNMNNAHVLGEKILSIPQVHEYMLDNLDKAPLLWLDLDDNDKDKFRKDVVLKVIHEMPNMIAKLPYTLQIDADIVKEASRDHDPDFHAIEAMYSRMDSRARENPEVCRILVNADPRVFSHLEYRDREITLKGLANDGLNLCILTSEEQQDKEYVMTAVNQNGLALEYASDDLKDDLDVVYAAVRNCGWAIHHASPTKAEAPDVIALALNSSPELSGYGVGRKNNSKR